jgi:putative NIF3 family GTP cyclohydrolase 1 type 2
MKSIIPFLALFATTSSALAQKPVTAKEIIERIQKNVGVPWRGQTVDTIKAGDPDTPITGVATTMMATFDVVRRAAAAGKNLVITHEPTFYGHLDRTEDFENENDAVFAVKKAFIAEHHMVIFRFHDHWHMHRPDGIQTGMARALGWTKYQNPANSHLYVIPEITLANLAGEIKERLHITAMRVVGDPGMKVTKVGMNPGAGGFASQRHMLQRDEVEALVIGEDREWEAVEYADDASAEGRKKALIILGHIPSEQAGMEDCAAWLREFVKEVPVEFIPAKEPFWQPR